MAFDFENFGASNTTAAPTKKTATKTSGFDFASFGTSTPAVVPAKASTKKKSGFGDKVMGAAHAITNTLQTLEKPFVDIAAIPVQAGVALSNKITGGNIPDPFANGIGGITPNPIDKPLSKVGSAGQIATYAIPYGRFAKLGLMGRATAGGVAGYGTDVASNLASGETGTEALTPGLGTALGVGMPLAGAAMRGGARLIGETLGLSTGTGYGSVKTGFESAAAGGEKAKSFTEAMRGKTSPDQIVRDARDSLGTIVAERSKNYQAQLGEIAKNKASLDVSPINRTLSDKLRDFKVVVGPDGLDFSQSAIRFNKAAQDDVRTIYETMRAYGTQSGDRTPVGVDSLKQALGDLYSDSSKVRALVVAVKNSADDILKTNVDGYSKLTADYAKQTGLIKEIQKGLSLGNKASTDTAFRKLVTTLRTNNEFRLQLVKELDTAAGGALTSKVAGQQMSELLPRGLARQLEGVGAVGALAGGFWLPLLKVAAITSPRLMGEVINALGLTAGQSTKLFNALGGAPALKATISPIVQTRKASQNQPPVPKGSVETPTAGESGPSNLPRR